MGGGGGGGGGGNYVPAKASCQSCISCFSPEAETFMPKLHLVFFTRSRNLHAKAPSRVFHPKPKPSCHSSISCFFTTSRNLHATAPSRVFFYHKLKLSEKQQLFVHVSLPFCLSRRPQSQHVQGPSLTLGMAKKKWTRPRSLKKGKLRLCNRRLHTGAGSAKKHPTYTPKGQSDPVQPRRGREKLTVTPKP